MELCSTMPTMKARFLIGLIILPMWKVGDDLKCRTIGRRDRLEDTAGRISRQDTDESGRFVCVSRVKSSKIVNIPRMALFHPK